jgi:hypothetical protein
MDANAVGTQLPSRFGQILLGQLISANMNSTRRSANYDLSLHQRSLLFAVLWRPMLQLSLTTAVGGIYPAVSKGGTAVVANSQAYSGLTAATKFVDLTIASGYTSGGDILTVKNLFLSLTTPQGSAATADVYVYGDIITL